MLITNYLTTLLQIFFQYVISLKVIIASTIDPDDTKRYPGTGCNVGSKTVLYAKWGKLPLKFTCPASTSTCPSTLLNHGELQSED